MPDWTPGTALLCEECGEPKTGVRADGLANPHTDYEPAAEVRVAVDLWDAETIWQGGFIDRTLAFVAEHPETTFHVTTDMEAAHRWVQRWHNANPERRCRVQTRPPYIGLMHGELCPSNLILHPPERIVI